MPALLLNIQSRKIIILCRDVGGYIERLSSFLGSSNTVTFIDVIAQKHEFAFLPGKLRGIVRRYLQVRSALKAIRRAGQVDSLLVVNPGQIDPRLVNSAMAAAKLRVAYLCDGIDRLGMPVEQLKAFDKVYTFDAADAQTYGLRKITNYIYEQPVNPPPADDYQAFVVMSGKHRVPVLSRLAEEFARRGQHRLLFLVQSKPVSNSNPAIEFFRERKSLEDVLELVKRSHILIDIVRPGHTGLSFRFFEALLYGKKIITNNATVQNYDFYNGSNVLVIDSENPVIPQAFIDGEYQPVPAEVLQRYTMAAWANEVFAPVGATYEPR